MISSQIREFTRGIVDIISEEELISKLKRGGSLRVKTGFDPTAPDIHLGHVVLLQKMKQFQDAGHDVIFLIGDFTGMIGDPSGKNATRPPLSRNKVIDNARTYQEQIFKILDKDHTIVAFNSEWMDKMSVAEFIKLASTQTVARMLERDDFKMRFVQNKPISIHEFMYPFVQGYDSVALRADVELGGTDQIFNLLMAREVQRAYGMEPQVVITLPLLEGLDGVQKMSKSYNNYVGVNDDSYDMFGKIMSISDEIMWRYYSLLSSKSIDDITQMKRDVNGEALHPMEAKMELASELVERFHDSASAADARERFERVFRAKALPDDMPEVSLKIERPWVCLVLKEASLTGSTSQAKRLIKQGAVKLNGQKISDDSLILKPDKYVIQVGKRRFAKVDVLQYDAKVLGVSPPQES